MKERYIKLLQDYYKKHGHSPKRREFANYSSQFNKVFGNWNKALIAAGLPILRELNPSKQKLIQSLKDFYNKHSRSPRAVDCMKKNKLYDTKTYLRFLKKKTWADVLKAAELPIYIEQSKYLDEDESILLERVKDFMIKKKITSYAEFGRKKGKLPSATFFSDKYGGWNEFMKVVGLEVNRFKYSKELFISEVKAFVKKKGYAPGLSEFAEELGIRARAITFHTGTFNLFIESLGYETKSASPENIVESNKQLKQLYIDFSNKHGYKDGAPSRVLNRSEEIYNADVFAIRFGSMNELRIACGYGTVVRTQKKYAKEEIIGALRKEYKKLGRCPTIEEINNNKTIPAISTILRYFNTTSMQEVWNIVLKK